MNRLDFEAPAEGMHIGHVGTSVRPGEGINEMISAYAGALEAWARGHSRTGTHDDRAISRGWALLDWSAASGEHEIGDPRDNRLRRVTSSAGGESEVSVSPLLTSGGARAGLHTADRDARAAASLRPGRAVAQTYSWSWSAQGEGSVSPAGADASVMVMGG